MKTEYVILLIMIVLVVALGMLYLFSSKKKNIHERFFQDSDPIDANGVSTFPERAFNEGYTEGYGVAVKEIDNAIASLNSDKNIKGGTKTKCADSDFYTWGRINGLAKGYVEHSTTDRFGTACNGVEGSNFKNWHTEDYRIVKNP